MTEYLASAARSVTSAGALVWAWLSWLVRHWALTLLAAGVALVGYTRDRLLVTVAAGLVLVLVSVGSVVWARWWPVSFERWAAGPDRRWGWRRWVRRSWPDLARECGLSVQRKRRRHGFAWAPGRDGNVLVSTWTEVPVWVHPKLVKAKTSTSSLVLVVRTRTGQTVDDLEHAAPALAAAAAAVSFRCRVLSSHRVEITLVMQEALATAVQASPPVALSALSGSGVGLVRMGRRQDGTDWQLPLVGRHTLVVGCSGAGKGSILWGVCGGLAPAVTAGLVQLWGVDLKKNVEVGMGRALFCSTASTAAEAIHVLRQLLAVIDVRGHAMAGVTRLHQPTPGDPLHVLVIDELAALVAYADPDTRKEAAQLLAVILTQGRALGVVVVACVQDPRKETIGMRSLFTQTIALRLQSADETRMVLGDGMAALAPAHRITPTAPGTAWVVEDDGTLDRVRADYWPDPLIRHVADAHPAPVDQPPAFQPATERAATDGPQDAPVGPVTGSAGRGPRAPRQPRKPRAPRALRAPSESGQAGGPHHPTAASVPVESTTGEGWVS